MVIFTAVLKDTGHPIKIDSDGQAEIVFTVPASDLAACLPLAAMGKKVLLIAVKEEEKGDKDFEEWVKE